VAVRSTGAASQRREVVVVGVVVLSPPPLVGLVALEGRGTEVSSRIIMPSAGAAAEGADVEAETPEGREEGEEALLLVALLAAERSCGRNMEGAVKRDGSWYVSLVLVPCEGELTGGVERFPSSD
jgi:hypothetical protein